MIKLFTCDGTCNGYITTCRKYDDLQHWNKEGSNKETQLLCRDVSFLRWAKIRGNLPLLRLYGSSLPKTSHLWTSEWTEFIVSLTNSQSHSDWNKAHYARWLDLEARWCMYVLVCDLQPVLAPEISYHGLAVMSQPRPLYWLWASSQSVSMSYVLKVLSRAAPEPQIVMFFFDRAGIKPWASHQPLYYLDVAYSWRKECHRWPRASEKLQIHSQQSQRMVKISCLNQAKLFLLNGNVASI